MCSARRVISYLEIVTAKWVFQAAYDPPGVRFANPLQTSQSREHLDVEQVRAAGGCAEAASTSSDGRSVVTSLDHGRRIHHHHPRLASRDSRISAWVGCTGSASPATPADEAIGIIKERYQQLVLWSA